LKISICLATYNGEKYLLDQLNSIIKQMSEIDELIISDDSSTDDTINIIKSINDKRLIFLENQKFKNPIFNFENAILLAKGDVIVLSDQDDIWMDCKLEVVRESFMKSRNKIYTIVMDSIAVDENLNILHKSIFKLINSGKGIIKNYYKNTYLGCSMAFSKELCQYILPFPKKISMHDIWIGLICEMYGEVTFVNKPTLLFRRHGNNATQEKYTITQIVKWRLYMFYYLLNSFVKNKIL
jgi:glycosyltransferase involved in cell wall biosynthesis